MSKASHYDPKPAHHDAPAPIAPKREDPKPVAAKPEAPTKTWQWDGSNHHDHPEWLGEHNPTVRNHALHLNAPQGIISAHKGEFVVKNDKGDIHVSRAHP